jgi:hypothetical protein
MDRDYDLFEVFSDGTQIWRDCVTGHESAIRRLIELAELTPNEVRVMHILTNSLIAVLNKRKP